MTPSANTYIIILPYITSQKSKANKNIQITKLTFLEELREIQNCIWWASLRN